MPHKRNPVTAVLVTAAARRAPALLTTLYGSMLADRVACDREARTRARNARPGGATNGLTRAETSEAILHTAIYAGLPAANAALGIARDTFAKLDAAS